jgi:excinuclease ABC subunit C
MTGDWDAINSFVLDREACVVVMEVRDGNVLGKKDYFMSGVQYTDPPAMCASFLSQYYTRTSRVPPEVHLPVKPEDAVAIEALLSGQRDGTVRLVYPQRGEKARILQLAATNAEHIMRETVRKRDRARDVIPGVVSALKRDLRLDNPPRTIACIDISHHGGTDTVGSLVFFRDGRPEKNSYRRFRIRSVDGPDDYRSMEEVVERYFTRIRDDGGEPPDLLVVDGGKGQLSSSKRVLDRLGFEAQPVAGLAKRLEEVFLPGAPEPQNIPKTSSALHLLQRIRDEAHRFAHTYQRKLATKRTISTALTEIPGVGPGTAKILLRHFGSVKGVRAATEPELAEAPGIGDKKAAVIHAALRVSGTR